MGNTGIPYHFLKTNQMRLIKVYNEGVVINEFLYLQLQELDIRCFNLGTYEFKANRDWWVIEKDMQIIAYCGCIYKHNEGICIFNRAWVSPEYRRLGIQNKMIKRRIKSAKENNIHTIITYTTSDNIISANNLIKNNFKLYSPSYRYADIENITTLYFRWVDVKK